MGLITTLDELTEYVEIGSLTDFAVLQPSLRAAERRYIVPILGPAQYTELTEAYADIDSISDLEQQLLDLVQEAIANIGLSYAVSRLSVNIADTGVRRVESDTNKSAFQYQEKNARDAYAQAGFDVLEDLLAFLETNKATFVAWAASTAYQDYRRYFIPSGVEFQKYYAIKQSRLVYNAIAPIMRNVENFALKDIIGKALFDALKSAQKAGTVSSAYQDLLDNYICPAVALSTIARGLVSRALDITENGVSVNLVGRTLSVETKEQATIDKFQAAVLELNTEAALCLQRLGELLASEPENYPDYVAPIAPSSMMNIDNKWGNSFFAV